MQLPRLAKRRIACRMYGKPITDGQDRNATAREREVGAAIGESIGCAHLCAAKAVAILELCRDSSVMWLAAYRRLEEELLVFEESALWPGCCSNAPNCGASSY